MTEQAPDSTSAKTKSPSDRFWETYLSVASEEDMFLPHSWEANTGGILTFTGLFAATVAAFLIESYKLLSPDSGDQTVFLLKQLLPATGNVSAQVPVNVVTSESFQVAPTTIIVNSLWFSSLLISLVCALLSTLIQEWARDYRRDVNKRQTVDESPRDRAYNHICVRMGIDRYGMDRAVYLVTALVHLSVLLFAIGLVIFLSTIDGIVTGVTVGVLIIFLVLYAVASVLPLIDPSCPYRTPVTYLLAGFLWLLLCFFPSAISYRLKRILPAAATIRDMTTRYIATYYGSFMTPARFAFVWNCTSRHMMRNREQLWCLAGSLGSLLSGNEHERNQQFEHIWADQLFFINFYQHLDIPSLERVTVDPFPFLLQSFPILFQGMLAFDDEHLFGYATDGLSVKCFVDAIHEFATSFPENIHGTMEMLAVQLCIADMRNRFHEVCKRVRTPKPIIQRGNAVYRTLYDGDMTGTSDLDSMRANLISARKVTHLRPLHRGDCCKLQTSTDTTAMGFQSHAAASNVLTAVSNLLEADPAFRDGVPVPEWLRNFYYSDVRLSGHLHLPSQEFVDVLCAAGLEQWLQSGGAFEPDPGSACYDYLSGPGNHLLRCLQQLAKGVNWDEYRRLSAARASQTPSNYQSRQTVDSMLLPVPSDYDFLPPHRQVNEVEVPPASAVWNTVNAITPTFEVD